MYFQSKGCQALENDIKLEAMYVAIWMQGFFYFSLILVDEFFFIQ